MSDIFPERLERTTGASPLERQQSQRDSGSGSSSRRRPAPPASSPTPESEPDDAANEPHHELDRLA